MCDAVRCQDVFVDRSPGGRREYCSTQCHTRTKVAAFRRRAAEAAQAPPAR
jgi:predicted RNA-binding Zn ribbon-like protein